MSELRCGLPLIYLITSGVADISNFSQTSKSIWSQVERAVEAGIPLVQIREKKLSARQLFMLVEKAAGIANGTKTKLLVNDRADIALAAGADGVHLTSLSIPARVIRENFPPEFIIGVSTHTLSEATNAEMAGANFIVFGPVYKTPSKEQYGEPQGIEKLGEVAKALSSIPVIAVGGVDETNCEEVLDCGASGFAAIRFFEDPDNFGRISGILKRYE